MKSNVYLASKPRYEILDGLRGVAAVLVVAPYVDMGICQTAAYPPTSDGDIRFFVWSRPVLFR